MWKDYSADYIKHNRASSVSIMAAALTASLFLSLLCCLSYNFWIYERERAALEKDSYQGILAFEETGGSPSMLLILYVLILTMASVSLILIIRNAFEVSMNARIHQFGILASIGATPRQIRICLLQEAAVLSLPSMIFGSLSGVLIGYGIIGAINIFAADVPDRHTAVFSYRPSVFLITMLVSGFTVLFSAWIPARKLSRITPLNAIRNADGFRLGKRRHAGILSFLFGVEGEIAGSALRAQRKSLRISTLSLLLSFLGFSFMLCFTTLSDISTRYTYFERYQDAWDIMITLKNTGIQDFRLTEELENVSGLQDVAVYQKAEAVTVLPEEIQSDELLSLGGLTTVAGIEKTVEGGFLVDAPVVVLDDASFLNFCSNIGIAPRLDGAIIYNRIWDSVNSNFRYPVYIPFVRQESGTMMLYHDGENDLGVEIPVLSYTGTVPVLREEYRDYGLVHFIPLTVWRETAWQIGGAEPDSCIRILSAGEKNAADLKRLEADALELVSREYPTVCENRIQERISNDRMIYGMKAICGGFCVLLALIGIANVFSNTLGFLRQRKREFARYRSIGFTPRQMEKLFWIEALVIAGRPFLVTVPLTLLFVQFCVKASYLEPLAFWREAPILPILLFAAAVGAFVALAYYIGGKRLLQCDFSEVLRNDTLV